MNESTNNIWLFSRLSVTLLRKNKKHRRKNENCIDRLWQNGQDDRADRPLPRP